MSSAAITPAESDVLLEARGITKTFPGVRALDGVSIRVLPGRLHALLGENGAGKSTLMNILSGVHPPDCGEILLHGLPVRFSSPGDAQRAGIAIIHQELNLVLGLSVAENIFLGREPLTSLGLVDYPTMHREARALLDQLQLDVDPRTPVHRLRVGGQQVVEIAKALSLRSRVIIMDEPTSALSENEVAVLFRTIDELKQRGAGIIYITHKLDELSRIADDITVLRDGRLISSQPLNAVTRDEMIRMMVGREIAEQFPKSVDALGDELLRVESVSLPHPDRRGDYLVEDVSFSVHRGEVVGIFGLMGAGRSELLQILGGLHPRQASGRVWIDGQPVAIRSPREAIAAGLALAPEDRKAEGLVLWMSVAENASLAALNKTRRLGLIQPAAERRLVARYVDRLGIRASSLAQRVRHLSGGNQQKVVLAKWLATDPKVLLLDEPTRGIDVGAKKEIYALIGELTRSGLGVVMVSSELPEILALSDRILVLCQGRQTAEFTRNQATEEAVLQAALPVEIV